LYVPAHLDSELVEQRIVEAAAVLPSYGGITGWAQLRWAGGVWFSGLRSDGLTRLPVVVATAGDDIRPQPGIQVSAEHLAECDLVVQEGLRATTALRSLLYEVRFARSELAAVVAIDMAAFSDLVSIAELLDYIARHVGWPGIRRAREALSLADENSWSPRETLMRVIWMCDAGFPRPLTNVPVFDLEGRHIGTPDILDPVAGVVGEYEGGVHLDRDSRFHDVAREGEFRGVGLEYFTMLAGDAANPAGLVARMIATRRRALATAATPRRWTVEKPAWWTPTETVAQRRALPPALGDTLLRHRRQ